MQIAVCDDIQEELEKIRTALDTYTIDLPEFVSKYNISSNEDKVLMNIQKVFDSINDKDLSLIHI